MCSLSSSQQFWTFPLPSPPPPTIILPQERVKLSRGDVTHGLWLKVTEAVPNGREVTAEGCGRAGLSVTLNDEVVAISMERIGI